jgi:hypothetical protein
LSYPVVAELDRGDLDALYQTQRRHKPGTLGPHATEEFILRHVFEIAPDLIQQPSDLLRCLLRRHYQGQRIPPILDARFIELLRRNGAFADWPLERIVPDRDAFFAFMQERWPVFLDRVAAGSEQAVHDPAGTYSLVYPGPAVLPFDHDDVRIYLDNLFLEGMLRPISHEKANILTRQWVTVGLRTDPQADQTRRLEGLITALASSIPASDARHQSWLVFAHRWAELIVLWHEAHPSTQRAFEPRFHAIRERVDAAFQVWIQKRYGGLHNLPPSPPVLLHHVPRHMAAVLGAHDEGKTVEKVALVLLDGLALDQWLVLHDVLARQRPAVRFREATVFAWLPTITSVSRQAAFAGKPPIYFPGSIHSTDKEAMLWTQFWIAQGFTPAEVAYARALGEQGSVSTVEAIVSIPSVRIAGLVVDTVDKIMHGMQLGTAGMHNQVRQWAAEGFMTALLGLLLDHGFHVFLTSDHGNIEAIGIGRPSEGAVADLRGDRVRVYPDRVLRARVSARFPDALAWPSLGLPVDYLPLFAPGRTAFIPEGERIVGHGGPSLEEVIVPLIRIKRRAR